MSFLPPFPLSVLVPLLVAALGCLGWLAWRSLRGLSLGHRRLLWGLRMFGLSLLAFILLNPGHWRPQTQTTPREWLVMLDRSGSMQTRMANGTRWEAAQNLADKLSAVSNEVPVRVETFGGALEVTPEPGNLSSLKPDAPATDIAGAVASAFTSSSASGRAVAGVILLSDGRTTVRTPMADAVSRARAQSSSIHAVVMGETSARQDLAVLAPRRQVLAFAGQDAVIPVQISSAGLGALRPTLLLRGADGAELQRKEIDLPADRVQTMTFTVPAQDAATVYTLAVAALPEEALTANNQDSVRVLPLHSKTRVFLAEGAPYWDSKFLAQFLRQQSHLDVMSVHRLSDTRYFKISSDKSLPEESSTDVFPSSASELANYDLLVFGKGAEYFLTSERIELLRSFVRDQGGAVFFSRGKAYAGNFPELESLEPMVWAEGKSGDFQFMPTAEGAAAGIFGQMLPAVESPVWATLPALRDGQRVDRVKPFTRVLATGQAVGSASNAGFPLLAVKRYGQGVVALLNADGLWKWDFFPQARTQGNMYAEFWSQSIQWLASYAEFLPGQEFSLRLSSLRAAQGDRILATVGLRGNPAAVTSDPVIHVRDASGTSVSKIATLAAQGEDGRKIWRATLPTDIPGDFTARLESATGEALRGPEPFLAVVAPPGEMENVQPDPAYLQKLVETTGGRLWTAEELIAAASELMKPPPPVARQGQSDWKPWWNRAWLALILVGIWAAEWAVRRRNGLV